MAGRKYSNKDNKKGNMNRWTPDGLSASDKKMYDAYNKKYGKARDTWADGSPGNPMPEIREQYKYDNRKNK